MAALTLMKSMRLRPSTLSGESRKRHSRNHLETMDSVADPVDYFIRALRTELEHGSLNRRTNVTRDDLRATAKIVAAHLHGVEHGERPTKWKRFPGYYDHLWYMEQNGRL